MSAGAQFWFADTHHNHQDLNFNEITQQTECVLVYAIACIVIR
jgi:hypothetical protein